MATTLQCEPFQISQNRSFWATQPDACGTTPFCGPGAECGSPGLLPNVLDAGVSLATNDWVRSLALNMLLTDARKRDTRCGHIPGTLNGHWSESFMARGKPVGSHVRYVAGQSSIRDTQLLLQAEIQDTLNKLVDYGVAVEVTVSVTYRGVSVFYAEIDIFGVAVDPTRIATTATRSENQWVWGV